MSGVSVAFDFLLMAGRAFSVVAVFGDVGNNSTGAWVTGAVLIFFLEGTAARVLRLGLSSENAW